MNHDWHGRQPILGDSPWAIARFQFNESAECFMEFFKN